MKLVGYFAPSGWNTRLKETAHTHSLPIIAPKSSRDPDVMKEKYPVFLSHTSEFTCAWWPFSSTLWKKRNKVWDYILSVNSKNPSVLLIRNLWILLRFQSNVYIHYNLCNIPKIRLLSCICRWRDHEIIDCHTMIEET